MVDQRNQLESLVKYSKEHKKDYDCTKGLIYTYTDDGLSSLVNDYSAQLPTELQSEFHKKVYQDFIKSYDLADDFQLDLVSNSALVAIVSSVGMILGSLTIGFGIGAGLSVYLGLTYKGKKERKINDIYEEGIIKLNMNQD